MFPGFDILETIYESRETFVYRARRHSDSLPVILKVLREDYPQADMIARYRREYEITSRLEGLHVIRALQWLVFRMKPVIAFEDFGGSSLREFMPTKGWKLEELLEAAIAIAEGMGEIHSRGMIHKNINPSNIVYNRRTRQLKIIDFGIATILHREVPLIQNPDVLEGTLAYVSPEQTGRMNRVLDYRSDFYSFGVTLYELFTGTLPIVGGDALELIYRHLTQRPPSMSKIDPHIPEPVSDIIAKLLEKNAEERYQSAWGIRSDLEKCLLQLRSKGRIDPFRLGERDIPSYFHLPQKLYGRAPETRDLLKAFERAGRGGKELMLVTGYSGIGKTRLVHEVFKPLTKHRGYFISGKFDQVQRNIPYSAFVNALQELVRQLLTESEGRLQLWRTRLVEALGQNGQIIVDLIPEVELIIGKQKPVPSLGPQESRNRFHLVFQSFIRVFHQPEHPLVVFLDDLQWVDLATLALLEAMIEDKETNYLFLVGAYRDNEVGGDHPLVATLRRIEQKGADVRTIVLPPLDLRELTELVSDTFHRGRRHALPLAELLCAKTGGNPFFVGQFLQTLFQENLIRFEEGIGNRRAGWSWDVRKIRDADITDNVVELMIGKLKKLDEPTVEALRIAACLGSQFDLDALAVIRKLSLEAAYRDLFPAIQENIVLPVSAMEVVVSGVGLGDRARDGNQNLVFRHFKFLHDRVQQAAYALIGNDLKPRLHLEIGRLLLPSVLKAGRTEMIFKLVEHLNRGREILTEPREKIELARLDLEAAKRAISAAAYGTALRYLEAGMSAFAGDWDNEYELTLALFNARADAEYFNGHYESSERFITEVWKNGRSVLDRALVNTKQITQKTMLGEYQEAIWAANRALSLLGMGFPSKDELSDALRPELAEIENRLGGQLDVKKISSLINLPEMTDPKIIVAMRILTSVHPTIYFTGDFQLYGWVLARMTRLSMQYGNIPESAKGYASFGNVVSEELGKFEAGYEFGMLGVRLSERYENLSLKCKTFMATSAFLNHWVNPIADAEALNEEGQSAGMRSGEFQYVSYILSFCKTMNRFHQGANLELLLADLEKYLVFTRKVKGNLSTDTILGAGLVISQLASRSNDPILFDTEEVNESRYLDVCIANQSYQAIAYYWTLKAFYLYLMSEHAQALECVRRAKELIGFLKGVLSEAELVFYESLILAAITSQGSGLDRIRSNQRRMRNWADHCPENFLHKYLLVEAELARVSERPEQAVKLYDEAIAEAGKQGFVQNEALANELSAKFWMGRGKEDLALPYARKARLGYLSWGAKKKEAMLRTAFARLRDEVESSEYALWSEKLSSHNLDLASVVKSSQAISSEIVLDRLLDRLMSVVIESAGADRASLILNQDRDEGKRLELVASLVAKEEEKTRFFESPLNEANDVPRDIIQYVARTRDVVVLRNAGSEGMFTDDPYVVATRLRSVLCLPIVHRQELIGVLCLQNSKIAGAFSPARVEVLKILSTQAAISLQNSLLLSASQKAVQIREEFITLASHELRTPLTPLKLQIQLIKRRIESLADSALPVRESLLGAVDGAMRQIDNLVRLFENLLDASRISAGKLPLEREVLDLSEIVRDTVERYGAALLESHCVVNLRIDGPARGHWDRLRLEQVVVNLLTNAMKYAAGKPIDIWVGNESGKAKLVVRDHGPGIPKDQQAKMFQRFERGPSSRYFGGLGLGLYITREIVSAHGGTIHVESEEGHGASLIVEIPSDEPSARAA